MVTWDTNCTMRELIDRPGVRMTYWQGALEITSSSRKHEIYKKTIARAVELFALERDIPLYAYGQWTLRAALAAAGLEPDECWAIGPRDDDGIPDVALEVVVTSGGINKLDVYAGLGIPEVWFWFEGAFQVYALAGKNCELVAESRFFPGLDFADIAALLEAPDPHVALKTFRDRLRG